jgi:2',3'-cyclic-nucleotide 2'-phosphodiesterase/3'-nucleotidase
MGHRRTVAALATACCLTGAVLSAVAAPAAAAPKDVTLTVLGTSDVHGHALDWDYYKDKPYSDAAGNSVGLAQVSTVVDQVRRENPNTLLVDDGDVIQGTPLDSYYATVEPITKTGATHPMAAAMNQMGYVAGAVGNHEFNYGVDYLGAYRKQLNFPLLAANVTDHRTGAPAFEPYVIRTVRPAHGGKPVHVGFLGLTTPGSAIWDKPRVADRLDFTGVLESAKRWVPRVRAAGADVVVVLAHSGIETSSSYGDALPWPENDMRQVAEQVPGIDAILSGHTHLNNPEVDVTNQQTGRKVVISQPGLWGERVSRFDLKLRLVRGHYQVAGASSSLLNPNSARPDPKVVAATRTQHATTVSYVNSVIGQSTADMPAGPCRWSDCAALDFINQVQTETVTKALTGDDAKLPVLSAAAPFNRDGGITAGDVTVRDIAGIYEFDNTLLGIKLTGAQVRAYLEKSAEYFKQVSGTGPYPADDVTNAPTTDSPNGTPDYLYDVLSGVRYDVDIAKAPGSRIENLSYDGKPVTDDQQFVLAINNYRQSGGGNFPGVTTAPVVYDQQVAIRESLIDWVQQAGTIDPAQFSADDWKLVANGQPVQITG